MRLLTLAARAIAAPWYVAFVFAMWVFAPELRRLVDWQSSFHSLSLLAVLPLVVLVPGLFLIKPQWSRIGKPFQTVGALWAIGFGYAFLIAILSKLLLPAIYQGALFGLPVLIGFFLSARATRGNIELDYERTAHSILWIAVITSLYGIVQFVSPTPWDVYWSRNANISSQGDTVAFSFRIFGTLNSTGVFAQFLALAILINVPRLRLSRWGLIVMMTPCVIALLLTEVRALWVVLAAGVLVYLLFTPMRRDLLKTLGAMTATVVVVGLTAAFSIGGADKALVTLTDRFQTFGSLDSDSSAIIRGNETTQALREGFSEPLGQGLGVLGQGGKLSDTGQSESLDTGYLSRFIEMGIVGFALYLAAIVAAAFATFKIYRAYIVAGNHPAAKVASMALSVQVALAVGDVFYDHHFFLPGLFFWYAIFYASAYVAPAGVRREPASRPFLGVPATRLKLSA